MASSWDFSKGGGAGGDLGLSSSLSTRQVVPTKAPLNMTPKPAPAMTPRPLALTEQEKRNAEALVSRVVNAPQKKPSTLSVLAKKILPKTTQAVSSAADPSKSLSSRVASGASVPLRVAQEFVVQPAARLVTQLGRNVVTGGADTGFTPQSRLAKELLGEGRVEAIDRELASDVATGYEAARRYNPGGLDPNDPTAKLFSGAMTPAFALFAGGLKALDVEPGGGAGKKVAKEALEATAKKGLKEGTESLAQRVLKESADVERLAPSNLFPKKALTEEILTKIDEPSRTALSRGTTTPKPRQTPQTPGAQTLEKMSPSEKPLVSYSEGVPQNGKVYNDRNLAISDTAKKALDEGIQTAKPKMEEIVGKTLSNREVEEIANDTGKVLQETVGREQTAARAAENLNLRREIARAAEDGKIDQNFIDLWLRDKAAGEDIARQLQARKITAKPDEARSIDVILNGIYKSGAQADEIIEASKNVNWGDPESVGAFFRMFVKPKASDWIDALRYNSMLSSPLTHISNASSNLQGSAIITPAEKIIAGGIDALRAALTGTARKQFAGEGIAYTKGYFSNVGNATKAFANAMRGKNALGIPDVVSIPMHTKGVLAKAEKALKLPVNLLEATDRFFHTLTESGVRSSLDYRVSKGLAVGDAGKEAAREASERLFRGELGDEAQGYVLHAVDALANLVNQAKHSNSKIISTVAKFTLPFVRTPTNILKQGISYSPLGLATLPGAVNKQEQLAKIVLGTSIATGVATLLGSKRLTWGTPTNAKEKQDFLAAGMQPYSVKIGDKWYSYSKLHPAMAFNFALISAVDDSLKRKELDDETADNILSSLAKWGKFFADQSYMKQIGDLVAGVEGDKESAGKIVANYASQLIPARALMGWVNNIIDPVQRQADQDSSILDQQMQWIMAQIPGFSQKVPARVDKWGNPILKKNRIINAFSPVRTSDVDEAKQADFEKRVELNASYAPLRREQQKERDEQQQLARTEYRRLTSMSPDEANKELERIKTQDKRLYDDLATIHKNVTKDFEIEDEMLQSLGVENGFRAQKIWETVQAMGDDKDKKNAYLQALESKKILSKQVSAQLYAHFIVDKLAGMASETERRTFLEGLAQEGKLTLTVSNEIKRLRSK